MQAMLNMKNKEPLPEIFLFKGPLPPHVLQYTTYKEGNTWSLVKHLCFGRQRGNKESCLAAFHGDGYMLDIAAIKVRQKTPAIVQYGLAALGGDFLARHRLTNPEIPENKKLLSQQDIKEAFQFISDNAPLGNAENQTLEWVIMQLNDPTSPLFGWKESTIKEACHNITNGKVLAQTCSIYPISLKDIKVWALTGVLGPCLRSCTTHGLLLLGATGIGKTPVANALAMASSTFWNARLGGDEESRFKTVNHIDYLRQEPPSKRCPIVFDDGELNLEPMSHVKGFFDLSAVDVKCKARWGAAAFEQYQFRIACSNLFDSECEPEAPV